MIREQSERNANAANRGPGVKGRRKNTKFGSLYDSVKSSYDSAGVVMTTTDQGVYESYAYDMGHPGRAVSTSIAGGNSIN